MQTKFEQIRKPNFTVMARGQQKKKRKLINKYCSYTGTVKHNTKTTLLDGKISVTEKLEQVEIECIHCNLHPGTHKLPLAKSKGILQLNPSEADIAQKFTITYIPVFF